MRVQPIILLLAFVVVFALSGCTGEAERQRVKSYKPDGYLGRTYTNPNDPSNFYSYHTYSHDLDSMSNIIKQVRGITDSSVAINGGQVTIRLNFPRGTSQEEQFQIGTLVQERLLLGIPRYTYRIKFRNES